MSEQFPEIRIRTSENKRVYTSRARQVLVNRMEAALPLIDFGKIERLRATSPNQRRGPGRRLPVFDGGDRQTEVIA
jgi:hypothetical protein